MNLVNFFPKCYSVKNTLGQTNVSHQTTPIGLLGCARRTWQIRCLDGSIIMLKEAKILDWLLAVAVTVSDQFSLHFQLGRPKTDAPKEFWDRRSLNGLWVRLYIFLGTYLYNHKNINHNVVFFITSLFNQTIVSMHHASFSMDFYK